MTLRRRVRGKKDSDERDAVVVERRRLAWASLIAFGVALLVLLVAILPAEYGVDPLGVGGVLGLTKLAGDGASDNLPDNVTANTTTVFSFPASWPTVAHEAGARDGYTGEGAVSDAVFQVDRANVTRVAAVLTWTDANQTAGQATRPDVFEVTVVGPDDREGTPVLGRNEEPGGSGEAEAWLDWRTAPFPRTLDADSEGAARAEAMEAVPTDVSGVGEWTVRVRMVEAGDADAGGLALAGPAADLGNDWTLTVTVHAFELLLGGSSAERRDTAEVTVPAGEGLEYKFFLNEGDPLSYTWSADGAALFYDFHGERPDAAPGEFTSHKSGTAQRDEGKLVAPFAGTHGWYFENGGTADVVVTLETRGVYAVVGVR